MGEPIKRIVPHGMLFKSLAAVVAWFLVFAAGLLVETVEHRYTLAPRAVTKQLGGTESIETPLVKHNPISAFLVATMCFTPINLAFLALVAGFVGGCASNVAMLTMPEKYEDQPSDAKSLRGQYMQEPPISAAIRGFIVYLCIIAGVYVVLDDPFKEPTVSQYIRLAGTISIMALVVGYEPSRLTSWFAVIPGPGRSSSSTPSGEKSSSRDNGVPDSIADASQKEKRADKENPPTPPRKPSKK